MKKFKIVFYLLLVALFNSCSNDIKLSNSECPVIMIAEMEMEIDVHNGGFLLQCGDGEIIESTCASKFGASISNTYNIGDTIIHCN
tara:strand:- start:744 stop:1001 length:258 start_codon:yes stop_codon:yes gene_type:complete